MIIGTVESISKTSLVVSGKDLPATTLSGKPVEALVATLKLGDSVEFEISKDGNGVVSSIAKTTAKKAAETPAPAAKTRSNSPVEKISTGAADGAWRDEQQNGARSW